MTGNEPAVRLDRPTSPDVLPRTHFQVPAREMLLDEPVCCPIYGALTFEGLAIDHKERVHLVVRTAARCVARCAVGGHHTAPETACTCGIHSFRDREHLARPCTGSAPGPSDG